MLKVMTVCYGGSAWLAEDLRPIIEGLGMSLVSVHEWDTADIKWDRSTWLDHMKQADIIICPANYKIQPAKSANRLTQAMSLGKPVICSPLDAYLQVEKAHPGCCLIADSKDEWAEKLKLLKDDATFRRALSDQALKASQDYSINSIGKKWAEQLFGPAIVVKQPLVDVIIVNYNNLRYLKLCVESIYKNTLYPFNLFISDAGSDEETWEYLRSLSRATVVGSPDLRRNYSEACNAGIEASNSEYFAILNSDLIVSDGWLNNMMAKFKTNPKLGACGVFSNCDRGWLHQESLYIDKIGIDLVPGMIYEQLAPYVEDLYSYMTEANIKKKGLFKEQEWVAGYATVYPRKVVEDVGLFDPVFKNGCEDLDFCMRMVRKGYKIGQSLDSFVFHFGGVSRGAYQSENKESYDKEDKANHLIMAKKWNKKRVMIYSGLSYERWDFRTMETTGIGGSEVWVIQISRELSKLGYKVDVFADCPEDGKRDGDVTWYQYTNYPEWCKYNWVDYAILSRTTDPLDFPLRAGKIYTQLHDVFYMSDKNKICLDKITKHCVLSQWHLDFASDYHGIPKDKMVIMANGIDFDRFDRVLIERQPYRFHWSSSLDRGLDNVLYMWPFIREKFPTAELHVYYGLLNWRKSCEMRNDQAGLNKIAEIETAMEQPGVFNHGRKSQQELAEEIKKASILLYPTWFSETFCCLPENKIFTDNGFKQIVDVSLRDAALTHRNRFRAITHVISRPFNGDVFSLKMACQMYDTGFFTGEHPILSMSARDVKVHRGKKYGHYVKSAPVSMSWRPIKNLKIGDYVCFPHPDISDSSDIGIRDILEDMKKINRNYKEINGRVVYRACERYKGFPRYAKMDKDFARFLGLYLSEGSTSKGTITMSFHTKEINLHKFIESFFKDKGIVCGREVNGNSTNIKIYCNVLGVWLKYFFGSNAAQKNVPTFLYKMPKYFISEFIKAIVDGDGCIGPLETKIQLASEKAILNIKMLMMSLGMFPSYTKPEIKPTQDGEDREFYSISVATGQWQRFLGSYDKKTQKSYVEFDGYVLFKIKAIEKKNYTGLVYNMDVEEDNSYVSGYQAVHNCIGAVEAQYAGVPVIANNYAGLTTTLADSAIMLGNGDSNWPYTKEGREAFLGETLSLLADQEKWQHWSDKGKENAKKYSWKNSALRWKTLFDEE